MKKDIKNYIELEKRQMDLEYEFVMQFISLRKELKMTQQQMADEAHVIRETIARIENFMTSPQVKTIIKILEPIGYTVKIVPIEENGEKEWEET